MDSLENGTPGWRAFSPFPKSTNGNRTINTRTFPGPEHYPAGCSDSPRLRQRIADENLDKQ